MKTTIYFTILVLFISCKESITNNDNETKSTIEILDLSPEAKSVVSSQDTIKSLLRYSVAKDIQSEFGFKIAILFVSTSAGSTFSIGPNNMINVTDKDGEIRIEYPLEFIWDEANLKHPVSFYFYLEEVTSRTALGESSTVIAKTEEINYLE